VRPPAPEANNTARIGGVAGSSKVRLGRNPQIRWQHRNKPTRATSGQDNTVYYGLLDLATESWIATIAIHTVIKTCKNRRC